MNFEYAIHGKGATVRI